MTFILLTLLLSAGGHAAPGRSINQIVFRIERLRGTMGSCRELLATPLNVDEHRALDRIVRTAEQAFDHTAIHFSSQDARRAMRLAVVGGWVLLTQPLRTDAYRDEGAYDPVIRRHVLALNALNQITRAHIEPLENPGDVRAALHGSVALCFELRHSLDQALVRRDRRPLFPARKSTQR